MKLVLAAVLTLSTSAFASFNAPDTDENFSNGPVIDNADTDFTEAFDEELAKEIAQAKIAAAGDMGFELPRYASCGKNGSTSKSERVNNAPSNGAAKQRSGSSTGCTAVGAIQPTDDALYYCWTRQDDNHTWTYLKNLRTGVKGWVRDDLLKNGGTFNSCGF